MSQRDPWPQFEAPLSDEGRARLEAIVQMTPEQRAADPEEFVRTLTNKQVVAIYGALYRRHPEPGTPEAEAFLASVSSKPL